MSEAHRQAVTVYLINLDRSPELQMPLRCLRKVR